MASAIGSRAVVGLAIVLALIWLAFWPIARGLDTHAAFTRELITAAPLFGAALHLLTDWSRPSLSGLDVSKTAYLLVAWYAVAFAGYGIAVRQLRTADARAARWVLVAAVAFQILFFLVPVLFTTDLFSYASYGEMQWRGLNPYTTTPLDLPASRITWLIPDLWRDAPSIYGPLWNLMSIPVANLTGGNPVTAALGYKLLVNGFHLWTVVLLWRALRRFGPGWQASGMALYAWNPMILIEFVANGHNDAVMVAFVVFGITRWLAGAPRLSLLGFATSIAVKYTSIIVVPFWLMLWAVRAPSRRVGVSRFVGGGAAVSAFVLVCYAPYFRGLDTFGPVVHWLGAPMFANTIAEPLLWWTTSALAPLLWWATSPNDLAGTIFRWIVRLLFVAYLLFEIVRIRRFEDALAATARTFLVFLLGVNSWVMPWYFLWSVPIAALLGWRSRTARWAVLTAAVGTVVIYLYHFGDRTVPVEAIHFLLAPSGAVAALEIVRRFRLASGFDFGRNQAPMAEAAQDAA